MITGGLAVKSMGNPSSFIEVIAAYLNIYSNNANHYHHGGY